MKLLPLAFLTLLNIGRADILFLDFNDNNSSIDAVNKAALNRGERVIVVTKTIPKKRNKNIDYVQVNEINKNNIQEILKKATMNKKRVSSIVQSGHDSGGIFSGKHGVLSKKDFMAAIHHQSLNVPDGFGLKDTVESLILRGCYTATLDETVADTSYQDGFKNLKIIAGYDAKAYSSEKKESKSYMQEILELEKDLTKAANVKDILDVYKKLTHWSTAEQAILVNNCTDKGLQELYVHTAGYNLANTIDIKELKADCEKNIKHLSKHANVIENFYYGEKGKKEFKVKTIYGNKTYHVDPGVIPEDTDKSILRDSYTWLRKNQHCQTFGYWNNETYKAHLDKDDPFLFMDKNLIKPFRILGLIFFQNVKNNFFDNYRLSALDTDIEVLNKSLKELGINKNFNLKMITKKSSRDDVRKFSNRLTEILSDHDNYDLLSKEEKKSGFGLSSFDSQINEQLTPVQRDAIQALQNLRRVSEGAENLLYRMEPGMLPFRWITEKESNDTPLFLKYY